MWRLSERGVEGGGGGGGRGGGGADFHDTVCVSIRNADQQEEVGKEDGGEGAPWRRQYLHL